MCSPRNSQGIDLHGDLFSFCPFIVFGCIHEWNTHRIEGVDPHHLVHFRPFVDSPSQLRRQCAGEKLYASLNLGYCEGPTRHTTNEWRLRLGFRMPSKSILEEELVNRQCIWDFG